jgi:cell division protein FtsB
MGNIHEQIDRFSSLTPRMKVIVAGIAVLLVVGVLAFVFWLGARSGDGWAESRYIRERDERLKKIAVLEESERQLGAENALLKKQNEAVAEAYEQADTARTREAAQAFTELLAERNKRLHEIDLDADFDSQICGLCSDAAKAGFQLSDEFCKRCLD